MDFNKLNNRAWTVRRMAAKRFNYPVKEIEWGLCLEIANETLSTESKLLEFGQFVFGFLSGLLFLFYCM